MDFEQALAGCGDNAGRLDALACSVAAELDRAYAQGDSDMCAALHYRFTRLCEYAREHLSPADYHLFYKKLDARKGDRFPLL